MTDRELLKLAARAAEYELIEWTDAWQSDPGNSQIAKQGFVMLVDEHRVLWNPLVDDGDALRLAVKLRIHIDCAFLCAMPRDLFGKNPDDWTDGSDLDTDDEYESMRRAIVRTVAKIGKSKCAPANLQASIKRPAEPGVKG